MITENSILQVEKDPVVDKNPGKKILVQDLEDSDEEGNFKVPKLKDMFDIPVLSPVGVSGYAGKVFISSKSGDQVLVYKSGTSGLVNRITAKPCPQQVLALQDGGLAVTTKKGLIIMDSRLQVVKELRCAKYGNIFGLAQQSKSSLLVVRTCHHHKRESVTVNSIDLATFEMKPLFSIQGVETPWMTYRRGNLYIVDDNTSTVLVYSWITGQLSKQMSPNIQNVGFGDLVVTKTGAVISVQHEDNKLHVFSPDFEYAGSILIPGLREDQDAFGVGLYLDDLTDLLYITLHGLDTVKVVKLL